MIDRLPYQLTEGVTATREGLDVHIDHWTQIINGLGLEPVIQFAITASGGRIIPWPDARRTLRFCKGKPWATVSDRDDDMAIACGYGDPHEWGGIDAAYVLHRLAVFIADDAEAFRMLHWGVSNLQESGG